MFIRIPVMPRLSIHALFELQWCHSADQAPTGPGSADPGLPYIDAPIADSPVFKRK